MSRFFFVILPHTHTRKKHAPVLPIAVCRHHLLQPPASSGRHGLDVLRRHPMQSAARRQLCHARKGVTDSRSKRHWHSSWWPTILVDGGKTIVVVVGVRWKRSSALQTTKLPSTAALPTSVSYCVLEQYYKLDTLKEPDSCSGV